MPAHSDRRFRFARTGPGHSVLKTIHNTTVSPNVRFIFDEPVTFTVDVDMHLINGQWFKCETIAGKEELTLIPGKWDN